MGAGISAALLQATNADAWAAQGRGPKLRQLFGNYRNSEIWTVQRKQRSMDDGNGWVSFEELSELLYFEEASLLFIWELFSQQNALLNSKELLAVVCIFSSAQIDEKVKFLTAVFDASAGGMCTGAEIAALCTMVLKVLGKCTGCMTKEKDVTPHIMSELPKMIPVCADAVAILGAQLAFKQERVIGQIECDRTLVPSIREAYDQMPVSGSDVAGAYPAPPPGWTSSAATESRPPKKIDGGYREKVRTDSIKDDGLAHLAWMRKLDDQESDALAATSANQEPEVSFLHRWLVMRGAEFGIIAKDLPGFRRLFVKSVCSALGLPAHGGCVDVLNVTPGSILVEFVLRPPAFGSDGRTVEDLIMLMEQQIANPHSALRRGQLAQHLSSAVLLVAEPQRDADAVAKPVWAALGSDSLDVTVDRVDMETQTDSTELGTPRAAKVKHAAASGACTEAEQEEAAARIREAVKELQALKARTAKAEAAERAALEEVRKRDDIITELSSDFADSGFRVAVDVNSRPDSAAGLVVGVGFG